MTYHRTFTPPVAPAVTLTCELVATHRPQNPNDPGAYTGEPDAEDVRRWLDAQTEEYRCEVLGGAMLSMTGNERIEIYKNAESQCLAALDSLKSQLSAAVAEKEEWQQVAHTCNVNSEKVKADLTSTRSELKLWSDWGTRESERCGANYIGMIAELRGKSATDVYPELAGSFAALADAIVGGPVAPLTDRDREIVRCAEHYIAVNAVAEFAALKRAVDLPKTPDVRPCTCSDPRTFPAGGRHAPWCPKTPDSLDVHARLQELVDEHLGTRPTTPIDGLLSALEKELPEALGEVEQLKELLAESREMLRHLPFMRNDLPERIDSLLGDSPKTPDVRREEETAIESAYEALQGRLGLGDNAAGKIQTVIFACEEYVAAEDALPGDEFDSDDYQLSKAVAALVKQRDGERDEREAAEEKLRLATEQVEAMRPVCEAVRTGTVYLGQRASSEYEAKRKERGWT